MTLSGICTVSKRKSCFAATSSIRRWTSGSLWPVKPMKRTLPAFFACEHGLHAPRPRRRCGRDLPVRMTSWCCKQVDHVGLQALEGLVDLLGGRLLGAAVDLGHEEDLLAVAVAQGLAHADLAAAVVVVPAVVHEVDAGVDGGADDLDALLLVLLPADVVAAQADDDTSSPVRPSGR